MLGIEEVLLGACGSRQTLTMTSRVIAWDVLSSGAVHLAGERELPTYLRRLRLSGPLDSSGKV